MLWSPTEPRCCGTAGSRRRAHLIARLARGPLWPSLNRYGWAVVLERFLSIAFCRRWISHLGCIVMWIFAAGCDGSERTARSHSGRPLARAARSRGSGDGHPDHKPSPLRRSTW